MSDADFPKSYSLEFCIVKLKNDLNIFERRQPISTVDDSSLSEDIPGAVYFQYDHDVLLGDKITYRAESEEKYPETHSRKYFFLPQKYMKEGNEAEVSELYTNLILRMELENPVTVVQVEPADYKEAFENDPNLIWIAARAYETLGWLNPVICIFSEKDQMDHFYAALAERNRDFFMNNDPRYLTVLVEMIEAAAQKRAKEDSFRAQHIEALSAAFLHLLKTSSYIPGKAQETQRCAKDYTAHCMSGTFNSDYDKNHSKRPEIFEELQANLFHLHLTRLVYQYYVDNRSAVSSLGILGTKPACWNPSNFGWDTVCWDLEHLFMQDIFDQSCFRRFLKDEQLRKNLGNFILHDYPSIIKDNFTPENSFYYCTKYMPKMETLFRGNYEDLQWDMFYEYGTLGFNVKKLLKYPSMGVSVMDMINITTAVLAMYPEEKGERRNYNYDITDVSLEVLLDKIYELYCQSKKEGNEVNPSAGFLWLGIAHRQAVGCLGELSEKQQTNCLEMLASALDYLPLEAIETFFSSIQGFATRKTIVTDILEDVDNIAAELGKALEQKRAEIEERITDYIARRKKEETAVLFLLHSEMGIEVVKVNANTTSYEKGHKTSAGIFIFMTLFQYTDAILECTSRYYKKTCDYYVLTFTKYLINNAKVKNIFNKKNQLRHAVREHIKLCLKHYDTYEQLNDLLTLDWQTYYNRWVAEKPIIGQYRMDTIKDLGVVGSGAAGSAHLCIVPNFMDSVVYKAFESGIEGDVTAELNELMKLQAHAQIVRIFGVVMQSQTPRGLLMEYCEGGSLESVIGKEGYTFEERTAFHWMAQAASGLKFLHDNNIIHLDVKPANMLLSTNHSSLKLSDMGLTKVGKKGTIFIVTSEKGTLGYQAWEIVDGKDYSYPADIFSLGRCLWSLFYKKHPYDNIVALSVTVPAQSCKIFEGMEQETKYAKDLETAIEKTKRGCVNGDLRICRYLRKRDETVYEKCPEHISKLIIRMTAVDPTLRPNAGQMYEELKEMCKAITEKDSILRVTPQSKLCFSAPMKDKQTANVEIANASKTDNLQWVAICNNPDLTVIPNEGCLKPGDTVTMVVTCIKLKDTAMDNFTIKWRHLHQESGHETENQQEHLKKLKIEYNF